MAQWKTVLSAAPSKRRTNFRRYADTAIFGMRATRRLIAEPARVIISGSWLLLVRYWDGKVFGPCFCRPVISGRGLFYRRFASPARMQGVSPLYISILLPVLPAASNSYYPPFPNITIEVVWPYAICDDSDSAVPPNCDVCASLALAPSLVADPCPLLPWCEY